MHVTVHGREAKRAPACLRPDAGRRAVTVLLRHAKVEEAMQSTAMSRTSSYNIPIVRSREDVSNIPEGAEEVRVTGFLFLHLVKAILERCKNLKAIHASACQIRMLLPGCSRLLEERGVELVQVVCSASHSRVGKQASDYAAKRQEFVELVKSRWTEFCRLRRAHVPSVVYASRYYCLQGEKPVSMAGVARENNAGVGAVFLGVSATTKYFKCEKTGSKQTMEFVKSIERAVEKLKRRKRERERKASERRRFREDEEVFRKAGFARPNGLNRATLQIALKVARVISDEPELFELAKSEHPREIGAVLRVYGFADGKAKTLGEAGEEMHAGRERTRQLETKGLRILGINKRNVKKTMRSPINQRAILK